MLSRWFGYPHWYFGTRLPSDVHTTTQRRAAVLTSEISANNEFKSPEVKGVLPNWRNLAPDVVAARAQSGKVLVGNRLRFTCQPMAGLFPQTIAGN